MIAAVGLLLLLLVTGCASEPRPESGGESVATAELSGAAALAGPSSPSDGDLDLHQEWRSAVVRQNVRDERARVAPASSLVVLGGEAHRGLLVVPSMQGETLVAFRVDLPRASPAELVAWVALEPWAWQVSDGVDFGIGVAEAGEQQVEIEFERLATAAPAWRRVRVDLAPFRGSSVWIVLASRERGDQSGDWLVWGDPRVRVVEGDADTDVEIDLAAQDSARRRRPVAPWSEATIYKTYSLFNDEQASRAPPTWIPERFPWLRSMRFLSSIGANWGPTLERDYEAQIGQNPTSDSRWEARWANRYEFFRQGGEWDAKPGRDRFDWTQYDRMNREAAASGLALHLNMAGAPETFCGALGHYHSYHFNEMPVRDQSGWTEYVDRVFAHLAGEPWFGSAHFSFFSEPNCRWTDSDGEVRKLGYQGDAADYARQYLWTWRAMKPHVRPGQVHLGPWVVEPEPKNPVVNNLAAYLRALRDAFREAGEPLPPWSGFAFNLYETPQLTLDSFVPYKIAYVRRLLRDELPSRELPIRLDEFGIHPLIAQSFHEAGGGELDDTRWAMAWHAEMLALLLDAEVASAASWVPVNTRYRGRAYPPYLAHLFLSYVVGAADLEIGEHGALRVKTSAVDARGPGAIWVQRAGRAPKRVGWMWSETADGGELRLALWRYPRFLMSDARLDDEEGTDVAIRLPPSPTGEWRVSLLGLGEQEFPSTDGWSEKRDVTLDLLSADHGLARTEAHASKEVRLPLRPGDLFLLVARPG